MTEASSFTTYNDRGVVGSVGRPVPWFASRLLGRTGRPVRRASAARSSCAAATRWAITKGYFRNPERPPPALRGGALHTGDLGAFDATAICIFHGRMQDIVRGEGRESSPPGRSRASRPASGGRGLRHDRASRPRSASRTSTVRKPKGRNALDAGVAVGTGSAERLAPYQVPRYLSIVARVRAHAEPAHHEATAFDRPRRLLGPPRAGRRDAASLSRRQSAQIC
jgi:crotonobetaine/carnitine-CoA ligase